jgi:hypothetical protein
MTGIQQSTKPRWTRTAADFTGFIVRAFISRADTQRRLRQQRHLLVSCSTSSAYGDKLYSIVKLASLKES